MATFGNLEVGNQFDCYLNVNFWASRFPAPEDGYAKSITAYLRSQSGTKPSRVRYAIYEEIPYVISGVTRKFARFVMATEEIEVPTNFAGKTTLNFTAPPPIRKDTKYFLGAWGNEDGSIIIARASYPQAISVDLEGDHMLTSPHGLGYPRFFEICPKSMRGAYIVSVYCTYDSVAPAFYNCPYCGVPFSDYDRLLAHIKSTPTEMIHLQICPKDGYHCYLPEEMQLHNYQKHGLGSAPESYSCIFCCSFKRATAAEVYSHINDVHPG